MQQKTQPVSLEGMVRGISLVTTLRKTKHETIQNVEKMKEPLYNKLKWNQRYPGNDSYIWITVTNLGPPPVLASPRCSRLPVPTKTALRHRHPTQRTMFWLWLKQCESFGFEWWTHHRVTLSGSINCKGRIVVNNIFCLGSLANFDRKGGRVDPVLACFTKMFNMLCRGLPLSTPILEMVAASPMLACLER